MPLKSDIQINAAKFHPDAISEQTKQLNECVAHIFSQAPQWFEVGAEKYRQMVTLGQTPIPRPAILPQALDITISSREPNRMIPCRLLYPSARSKPQQRKTCKGTMLHVHGGGWVLGDHKDVDEQLQLYADAGDVAVLSVGYRLAPQNPFPKGIEDCLDVGEYLVRESVGNYGGPLRFLGGESAGAHLSLLVALQLLKTHPTHTLAGLVLNFGCFDLSDLPSARNYPKTLVLSHALIQKFKSAFLPNMSPEQLKLPSISPYYEDLSPFLGRLPSALFVCGTDDPLLDDSVNMGVKWLMAGGEAVVKIYPGAAHGFLMFSTEKCREARLAVDDIKTFIGDCMARVASGSCV